MEAWIVALVFQIAPDPEIEMFQALFHVDPALRDALVGCSGLSGGLAGPRYKIAVGTQSRHAIVAPTAVRTRPRPFPTSAPRMAAMTRQPAMPSPRVPLIAQTSSVAPAMKR